MLETGSESLPLWEVRFDTEEGIHWTIRREGETVCCVLRFRNKVLVYFEGMSVFRKSLLVVG